MSCRPLTCLLWLALVCQAGLAAAADVHSNGMGGGRWSDPATWHGGKVPGPEDVAVIAMRDTVVFDRHDSEAITCAELHLDPEAVLAFAANLPAVTLHVHKRISSYGVIQLDGTRNPRGTLSLIVGGPDESRPTLQLQQYAALLAYGAEHLPDGARNVVIEARGVLKLSATEDTMVDLHRARITNVHASLGYIDNTGATPTERLNIIGNHITGDTLFSIYACDTATVRENLFDAGEGRYGYPVYANNSKLLQFHGNTIRGYRTGLLVNNDTDSSAANNLFENCDTAISWHGGNAMIGINRMIGCGVGVNMRSASGVIENVHVSGAKTAFLLDEATMQLNNARVDQLAEEGVALQLNDASATLLNCNIDDDQIKFKGKPREGQPWVKTMRYLVVAVEGDLPDKAQVMLQTAKVSGGVPKGKADLNVRNVPAPISPAGMTPMPATHRAIVARSWQIGRNGKRDNAPFYDLSVVAADGKTLVSQQVEPDQTWFRPDPNDPVATMKVVLP